MAKPTLLASSASFDGILGLVAEFYCGRKAVLPVSDAEWSVHRDNGNRIDGVRVVFARGRYRFESLPLGGA